MEGETMNKYDKKLIAILLSKHCLNRADFVKVLRTEEARRSKIEWLKSEGYVTGTNYEYEQAVDDNVLIDLLRRG